MSDRSIRATVEAMLRSDVFYSPKAYRALVKSPVEYTVGAIKAVNGQAQLAEADWQSAPPGRRHRPDGPDLLSRRTSRAGRATRPGSMLDHVRAHQLPQHGDRAARANAAQPQRYHRRSLTGLGTTKQALDHFLPLVLGRQHLAGDRARCWSITPAAPDAQLSRRRSCGASSTWCSASPQFHARLGEQWP